MAIQKIHVVRLGQLQRHFVLWAQREGYELDIISQTDLHYRPELLEGYSCVALIGHDEYWSWEMRDAIDALRRAWRSCRRFAGNFMWQIRLENEGQRQVCYKYIARDEDPFMSTGPRHLVTESWEAPESAVRVRRASASTPRTASMPAGQAARRACKGFPRSTGPSIGPLPTPALLWRRAGPASRIYGYEVDGPALTRSAAGFPIPQICTGTGRAADSGARLVSTVEEGPTIMPGRSFLGSRMANMSPPSSRPKGCPLR